MTGLGKNGSERGPSVGPWDPSGHAEGGAAADNGRVLNQDEIESLLGFGDDTAERGDTGLSAVINSGQVSYERLPMLEVIFDRLVRFATTSLRNFTSDNVIVTLDRISSVRFGDFMRSVVPPAMFSVIKAVEWDDFGLVVLDGPLIYSVVDVLLGGRRGMAAMRLEGRSFTTIERSLVERMVRLLVNDLSAAFSPLSPVVFRLDRVETNPRFAAITRPANVAVVVRLRIDMEERGGHLDIVLPHAMLEPIRELLLQMFMGEKFGRDAIWEAHLVEELRQTEIELRVIMDKTEVPLSDIFALQVGSRILFDATPDALVELHCAGVPLYRAKMGRRGSRIAVQIEDRIDRNEGECEA